MRSSTVCLTLDPDSVKRVEKYAKLTFRQRRHFVVELQPGYLDRLTLNNASDGERASSIMRTLTILGAVVLLSLLSTKPSDGQAITVGPANTAALTGTQNVQLNCSATFTNDYLAWSYLNASTTTYTKIFQSTNGNVIAGFEDRYSISVDGDQYNLIVKEVTQTVATKYECQLVLSANEARTADLLAVDELQCPSSVELVEGTELLLSCGVVYYFSQQLSAEMMPVLSWSIGASQNNSIQTSISNSSYAENILNVTVYASDDETDFTCNLQFSGTSAPEYTSSCVTAVYVLYGVNDIALEPNITDGQELEVGTVITCITNGRPAPTIVWLYDNGKYGASDNENLTVTEDMVGQGPLTFICQANNTVANLTYDVQINATFVAVDINTQPVSTHGVETWVIVVAVVVPVVVLAAAGIAAFFVFRHYRTKKSKKASSNGTTATAMNATYTTSPPAENQPFLYSPNQPPQQPLASPRTVNNGVSYQPNGSQSRSGFADLGGDNAMPLTATAGGASIGGSQYSGSSSRVASPNPMSYPYAGPAAAPSGVNGGPGPAVVGRGTPAITAGPQLAAYAGSTGRLPPATDVSVRANPVAYPYAGPARQTSNASSASRGSSYHGGSQQNLQPPPLSYPPARPGSAHNSSLV